MDGTAGLVRAAQGGDQAALAGLLAWSWDRAYRLARRLLRDREAAEDAAQDACAQAVRMLGDLRDPSAYRLWFDRLAARIALRHVRGPIAEPLDGVELAARTHDAADAIDLNAAIDALSATLRVPVLLFYGFDFTSAEIARALGVPDGTVRWRLSEARRRLRIMLSEPPDAAVLTWTEGSLLT